MEEVIGILRLAAAPEGPGKRSSQMAMPVCVLMGCESYYLHWKFKNPVQSIEFATLMATVLSTSKI